MYAEDLELGLRAHDEGVDTALLARRAGACTAAGTRHAGRSTASRSSCSPSAGGSVVRERRGAAARRVDDLLQLTTFCDRLLLKRLAGRPAERERRQLASLLRYLLGRRA